MATRHESPDRSEPDMNHLSQNVWYKTNTFWGQCLYDLLYNYQKIQCLQSSVDHPTDMTQLWNRMFSLPPKNTYFGEILKTPAKNKQLFLKVLWFKGPWKGTYYIPTWNISDKGKRYVKAWSVESRSVNPSLVWQHYGFFFGGKKARAALMQEIPSLSFSSCITMKQ